jgi:hypothetical protein
MIWLPSDLWTWWLTKTNAGPIESASPELGLTALEIMRGEVGRGEEGGNNRGPDIERYRGDKIHAAWCAAVVGHCYERAAARLGIALPFRRSHNAKRQFRRACACDSGVFVEVPALGDIACWWRGERTGILGHTGIVSGIDPEGGPRFHTLEGNKGPADAKVAEFAHQLGEKHLIGFARVVAF